MSIGEYYGTGGAGYDQSECFKPGGKCIVCNTDGNLLYDTLCQGFNKIGNVIDTSCPPSSVIGGEFSSPCDIAKDYTPDIRPIMEWLCNLDPDKYTVCATPSMADEFAVYGCGLDTPGELKGVNRKTDYITAVSLYPYQAPSKSITIKAFCPPGVADKC